MQASAVAYCRASPAHTGGRPTFAIGSRTIPECRRSLAARSWRQGGAAARQLKRVHTTAAAVGTPADPAPAAAPAPSGHVSVQVSVPDFPLAPGEHLRVVGACAELGAWDPSSAPPLAWAVNNDGSGWSGALSLPLPPGGGAVNFKLVIMKPDGSSYWEEGPDRVVQLPVGAATLSVLCAFGDTSATSVEVQEVAGSGAESGKPEGASAVSESPVTAELAKLRTQGLVTAGVFRLEEAGEKVEAAEAATQAAAPAEPAASADVASDVANGEDASAGDAKVAVSAEVAAEVAPKTAEVAQLPEQAVQEIDGWLDAQRERLAEREAQQAQQAQREGASVASTATGAEAAPSAAAAAAPTPAGAAGAGSAAEAAAGAAPAPQPEPQPIKAAAASSAASSAATSAATSAAADVDEMVAQLSRAQAAGQPSPLAQTKVQKQQAGKLPGPKVSAAPAVVVAAATATPKGSASRDAFAHASLPAVLAFVVVQQIYTSWASLAGVFLPLLPEPLRAHAGAAGKVAFAALCTGVLLA